MYVAALLSASMKITEFEHPNHPDHILMLKSSDVPYKCDGCKELGFGPCFKCEDCNFHLHEECALASKSSYHPLLKRCELRFCEETYGGRYCDACGKDVMGFVYQCTHDNAHDLHPCCLKLQRIIIGDGFELRLSDKVPSKCLKCNSKEISRGIKGWSYVSSCGEYCYHVACVKDLVLENWRNGYFDGDNDNISAQTSNLALLQIASPSNEVAQRGGRLGSKAKKFWRIAKMVLKLIISAIFGDPTGGIAIIVEALVSSTSA
ncbi:hypothetical protein FEM48_Zijuj03G0068900 [Ziziphus jujuba var. spinosa]|uniref:Phorbol-ester/DAG-type domain-containing protein n=1 Tax=Ziziphus jujuba var. spinosa TaxID=714518 RepID=A0A978VNT9_ZIZJJ|nr:hypothetical protein FEM48_Zijuj03G0068900 [Ziziphus jujuba var. spinosa]